MLNDSHGNPIDAPVALSYTDASGTPQISPASPSVGVVTLVPPAGAIFCVFQTQDAGFVSNTADQSTGKYPLVAGSDFRKPCGTLTPIYIATAQPVHFFFELH